MTDEPARFYGFDVHDVHETLAEATVLDDGTIRVEVVVVDVTAAATAQRRREGRAGRSRTFRW